MTNDFLKIICPNCGIEISLDEVITHQLREGIIKEFSIEQQKRQTEFLKRENEIQKKEKEIVESQKTIEKQVTEQTEASKEKLKKELRQEIFREKEIEVKALSEELEEKKKALATAQQSELKLRQDRNKFENEKQAFELDKQRQLDEEREKIKQDTLKAYENEKQLSDSKKNQEIKLLNEQLGQGKKQIEEMQKTELNLRKEKIALEESKRAFELEKQRQLDNEREKISHDAQEKAEEVMRSKINEKDKQLQDAIKVNQELQRKLQQGSQQTQGEVLELELEEILKAEFQYDEIMPVPKGISGADIIQEVKDRSGRLCGHIAWESKKTKAWSDGWIQKLKDDQRTIKADLAVIVSAVLPEGVKGFVFRDGVWICDIKLAAALATALRINLESITREKAMSVGKNEKMEVLYGYLTGIEFKQRVEAIVEAFTNMDEGLRKERIAFEKIWSEREKQIKKVIT
ncbi:MAG: DUF2130 domain-containing protein, partial [bacterium]